MHEGRRPQWALGLGALAVALAACGDDAGTNTDTSTTDASTTAPTSDTTVTPATSTATTGVDSSSDDGSTTGPPPGPPLTDDQRRAFLHYYAPVIFKRADETDLDPGRDFIANFDFDADDWSLSNNRANWLDGIGGWTAGTDNPTWDVRPTLYTAAIEFAEAGSHDLVLLYHVYHAEQGMTDFEDAVPESGSVHDWERVEIRIDGVTGDPGGDETIRYIAITEHADHVVRTPDSPDLNFMVTAAGRHAMIFQAEQTDPAGRGYGELRFVTEAFETVMGQADADLSVAGTAERQAYHYVFTTHGDADAVAQLGAMALGPCTADALAAGVTDTVPIADAAAIEYELQDTADVFFSHLDRGTENLDWHEPRVEIELSEAIVSEDGTEEVAAGRQGFFSAAYDDLDPAEDRQGYPGKPYFWGAYLSEGVDVYDEAFADPARCEANGLADCADAYWGQHDYFVHDGVLGDGTLSGEAGHWLPAGWHTVEGGGFDGRWVQLFADDRADPCG